MVYLGPAELPTAGTRRGRQEVAAFFKAVADVFEIQRCNAVPADGDRVVALEHTAKIKATAAINEPAPRWE